MLLSLDLDYIYTMARVRDNLLVDGFSGKLGDIIFKHYRFGTVVSRRPNMSKVKRTSTQKKNSSRFVEAVKYARSVVASPMLKKTYEKKAKKSGRTIYHLALADYMRDASKTLNGIPLAPPAGRKTRK
jgi:hypothetical protein